MEDGKQILKLLPNFTYILYTEPATHHKYPVFYTILENVNGSIKL